MAASALRVHRSSAASSTARSGFGGMPEKPMRWLRAGAAGGDGELTLLEQPGRAASIASARAARIGGACGRRSSYAWYRQDRARCSGAPPVPVRREGIADDGARGRTGRGPPRGRL